MRHTARLLPILLILSAACASIGTSDPVLVRSEDFLSNSLIIYNQVMTYHFANSTTEKPDVYRTMEKVRTGFPTAWKALYDGSRTYKVDRDAGKLQALLDAATTILNSGSALIH